MVQNVTTVTANLSLHSSVHISQNLLVASDHAEIDAFIGLTFAFCALGTITNSMMLVAVWPAGRQKSGFAWLMCHFLLVQLSMCLIHVPIPLYGIYQTARGHQMSAYNCRFSQSFYSVCTAVINWSDAGLAFNRCIALFFPHKYSAWTTKSVNTCIIVFAWIPSAAGYIVPPLILGFDGIDFLTSAGYCTWAITPAGYLGPMPLYLATSIPYSFTGLGAFLILCKFYWMTRRRSVRRAVLAVAVADNRNRPEERRLKRAKVLLFMLLWTGICVAPGPIAGNFFRNLVEDYPTAVIWLRVTLPLQYSVTPIILLLCNEEYQERLSAIFKPVFKRITSVHPTQSGQAATLPTDVNLSSGQQPDGSNPEKKVEDQASDD